MITRLGLLLYLSCMLALSQTPTPSAIVGTWAGNLILKGKATGTKLRIVAKGKTFHGTLTAGDQTLDIDELKLDGKAISFTVDSGMSDAGAMVFRGTLDNNEMNLGIFLTRKEGSDETRIGDAKFLKAD